MRNKELFSGICSFGQLAKMGQRLGFPGGEKAVLKSLRTGGEDSLATIMLINTDAMHHLENNDSKSGRKYRAAEWSKRTTEALMERHEKHRTGLEQQLVPA